jgi:PKD repeat protein
MKRDFLKMLLIAVLPICAVSCIDNVPEVEMLPRDAVSFNYYIDQKTEPKYYLDFYIDSDITFVNTSPESTVGEPTWDFGDGAIQTGDNVVHFYEKAGTYKVKLTIGNYSKEQYIMIAPIKPIVKVKVADPVCEVRKSLVTFDVELPNPKNKPATFFWTFPADTKDGEGSGYATFEGQGVTDLPAPVKFSHVGSQQVQLNVKLGDDDLEPTLLNVQVAYDQEVPTLYYAVQGGRIMAHKLTGGQHPSDMNISSYDLGVASGQHPFTLLFKDSLLYVLDAGKQFYYVNDVNGVLGDGKISVISKDGSKVQTMISNAGQQAFDDPFYGCIDGDFLYYANRNTGMVKMKLTDRDKVYSLSEYPWYVQQATLGYYNNGWGYGTIGGVFGKINGVWHWTRFYNGNGIYRFLDSDILPAAIAKGDDTNKPKAGIMLEGMSPKSFVYTAKSATPKMCVHVMDAGYNGFYACTYDELEAVGTSKNALKPYAVTYDGKMFESNTTGNLPAVEGSGSEAVGICQMAYDEVNDCVYFGYRNNSVAAANFPPTGIYCYNVATGQVTCLIEGVSVYGLAVNNNPAKLF